MKAEEKIPAQIESSDEESGWTTPRYHRLRRLSITVTSLVALIPLMVMLLINYYQDQESYHAESFYTISRMLSNTQRTLEYAVQERKAALSFIISEIPYEQLTQKEHLQRVLQNLNHSFGGFVDLGIIDSSGNQAFYVGPYNLEGKNYRDQAWFSEVNIRGEFVSDVFMGFRNIPHFVIAFKHEKPGKGYFIFRATIDMEMISKVFYSLDMDRNTDAFLINQKSVLQTSSIFYGSILTQLDIEIPPRYRHREVIDEYEKSDGKWETSGFSFIQDTPFILCVIKQRENPFLHWLYRRSDMLWFLLVSIILILAVVVYGSSHTIKRLRELDKRRAKVYHNIEYTNKMATIGRMAAGIAHEINNPLAIINEKAGLLSDLTFHSKDLPDRDKFFGLAESITKSVERCSGVTRRLLGFARRMDVKKEAIEVKQLLEEVISFQKTEMIHRKIDIKMKVPEGMKPIISDRGQLQQVFLNIVNNAFAAVDIGGEIIIETDNGDAQTIAVSVTDNGVGISENNLKHIFEPFYSTKGEFGTGLGLSITHDIVQKLGGSIKVRSKLGEGTCFTVILPRETNH